MFKAGFTEGLCVDELRRSWASDDPRPLTWVTWYPAIDEATESERLIGPIGNELFVMGVVAPDAPINDSRERWPTVLISHGTGGSAVGMGWLGRRLAAAGFIALAVNHHGNTATEQYLAEGFLCWWERARDLSVVLDQLNDQGPVAGRLDFSRIFAAGFSLGGYTALALAGAITDLELFQDWIRHHGTSRGPREFPDVGDRISDLLATSPEFRASQARHVQSHQDPRVKAAFVFAPAPPIRSFTPESLAAIRIPIGIMVGEADNEAPHQTCACWLTEHLPKSELTFLGPAVGHYVFLCEATDLGRSADPVICVDAPLVSRAAIHDRAAAAAIRLFQAVS